MKAHMKYMSICGIFAAAAIVLVATGTSAAILIPVAACGLMMGGMMVAMGMLAKRHGGH